MSIRSAMVSKFCVRPTSRGGFWKQSKWPWNMIHSMPCRNPCRPLHPSCVTYSVDPSNVLWSKLGPTPPFPPMRVFEAYLVTSAHSRVWNGRNKLVREANPWSLLLPTQTPNSKVERKVITLFRSITMFHGTNNIWKLFHSLVWIGDVFH